MLEIHLSNCYQIILDLEWDIVPDKTDNVRDSKVISSLNLSIPSVNELIITWPPNGPLVAVGVCFLLNG